MGRHEPRPPLRRGFTLIELMIAIAVVAILASLAVPTFLDTIRKSRRADAVAAVGAVQQAQERRRANVAAYTSDLDLLGQPSVSSSGHYGIRIDAADANGYVVTASATGSQARDVRCARMRVLVTAGSIRYASACSTCDFADPPTDPNRCWSAR